MSKNSLLLTHCSVLVTQSSLMMMVVVMGVSPAPFLVAKNQGFDHDRNGLGIGEFLADIDKIKILKDFDFVDIGEELPDAKAVPVVIKSLIFRHKEWGRGHAHHHHHHH